MVLLAPHFKLLVKYGPKEEYERKFKNKIPYVSVIGYLMYIMICTRPNLAYSMNVLCRNMKIYGKAHLEALKLVFSYVRGSLNHGLTYEGGVDSSKYITKGYNKAEYGKSLDFRMSISGYLFTMFKQVVS